MCRLLCVSASEAFSIAPYLEVFAQLARDSEEYQGHGWGCAWRAGAGWQIYRNVAPIWEDPTRGLGRSTTLLAHARSAFRDEGICVENNMPFADERRAFIFNGELQGVRIKERGRIGAEKIFNHIKRFDRGDLLEALRRAATVIEKRTRYVRALNLLLGEQDRVLLCTHFNERPEYFQMHRKLDGGRRLVCSRPFPAESGWQPIPNRTIEAVG